VLAARCECVQRSLWRETWVGLEWFLHGVVGTEPDGHFVDVSQVVPLMFSSALSLVRATKFLSRPMSRPIFRRLKRSKKMA